MPSDSCPVISVITVVYNNAPFIEKTILSVIQQNYGNIEYIIVDGASDDGTVDIIKKYEKNISKWISEPDEGLYHAMNKGMRMASGDYIWFVNGGDEIYCPDTLSNIFSKINDMPDILYGNTIITDKEGREIGDRRLKPPEKLTWKSFKKGMLVSHQSIIVKREIATDFNLRYRLASDIDWAIRSLKAASSIQNTYQYLSRFMEGGISRKKVKQGLRERYKIMVKYYGFIPTTFRHFFFGFRLARFYFCHRRF